MHYHSLSVLRLSVLAAALLASLATPLPSPWGEMLVKHKWVHVPDKWVTMGHPPDGTTIDLYIALKPDRENALIDAPQEVSQPKHPKRVIFTIPSVRGLLMRAASCFRYGAHLTKEQVAQLVAPHPDTLKLVSSWLRYNGVPPSTVSTTHGGGWLTVTGMPVSQANKLLGASYELYYHPGTDETILRTVGYALPEALHIHVQTIAPTTAFTSMHLLKPEESPRSRSGGSVNATLGEPVNISPRRQDLIIVPSILREVYGTVAYSPAAADRNKLGIVGFKNEVPSAADLSDFMTEFRTDALAIASIITVEPLKRNINGQVGRQANFNVQYALALAYPTPIIYYMNTQRSDLQLLPGSPLPDPRGDMYLVWLDHMLSKPQPSIPQTIVLGFAGTPEPSITAEYAIALCRLFARLGVLGASVLVPSGDDGAGKDCRLGNGFYTTFPASWMCGVYYFLAQAQVQVAHQTVVISQVPLSLVLAVPSPQRPTSWRRSPIGSPGVASRLTFRVVTTRQTTRTKKWYGIGWLGINDITSGYSPGCRTAGFSAIQGWDPVRPPRPLSLRF
jgi:tripeptidyl-peptidase-1